MATEQVAAVLGADGRSDGPTVDVVVEEGPTAAVLVRRADGAHLLVIGSRGHGTLPGLILGSVALRTVVHAECPVMVVRASGSIVPDAAAGVASAPSAL
jgi:nucleotide-binding universal stress UspA family protein